MLSERNFPASGNYIHLPSKERRLQARLLDIRGINCDLPRFSFEYRSSAPNDVEKMMQPSLGRFQTVPETSKIPRLSPSSLLLSKDYASRSEGKSTGASNGYTGASNRLAQTMPIV